MTPFTKLEAESRADWREGDVTQAFIAEIHRERQRKLEELATAALGGTTEPTSYARYGGALEVIDYVIRLLEK
jgi:hypothetical protein